MSLQITTKTGSLIALGLGISDIATIVSLSRRFGNWMTAASGDADFLEFLDTDELEIIRRRGLLDVDRFNKVWGHRIALLANGKPTEYEGEDAEKVLEKFSRFTAIMVCLVAAMDAFMSFELVRSTLRQVLLALLRTTEFGEDILASRYPDRLNSWRSSSTLRGLASKARQIRRRLLDRRLLVDGLMPQGDRLHMIQFLIWLLAESGEDFTTQSSDVAGVASCLSELGIDLLSVEGLGEAGDGRASLTSCRVRYSSEAIMRVHDKTPGSDVAILGRVSLTTVSLLCPEEALTNFPIHPDIANRCRTAWQDGARASEVIKCRPVVPNYDKRQFDAFWDTGSPPLRVRDDIRNLVSAHAFAVNKEICQAMESVFQHEPTASLKWVLEQTTEEMASDADRWNQASSATQIWNFDMQDPTRINAFTVFQAFFMGYYYAIFLRLVDTSSLRVQTVDGAWGYRSSEFLCNARNIWLGLGTVATPGVRILRRERVFSILSELVLGKMKEVSKVRRAANRENWCVGIIEKHSLMIRSLLKPCRTIREAGEFVMLDVDTSGIPRDMEGLVRPGVPERRLRAMRGDKTDIESHATEHLRSSAGESEDVTFNIEADWDGDPETMLLCVRYKGRRIETINPATADTSFLQCLLKPKEGDDAGVTPSRIAEADVIEQTAEDILSHKSPDRFRFKPVSSIAEFKTAPNKPCLIHIPAPNRPRLRYYGAEIMRIASQQVLITSDNLAEVFEECWGMTEGKSWRQVVLISGSERDCKPTLDDWVPKSLLGDVQLAQKQIKEQDTAGNMALGNQDIVLTVGTKRPQTWIIV
ncbi:hypothetical protein BDV95DRAFT_481536 [Massariosphaeria phaeospora]|uniref:Uncharacterized protein n=1 Tax=Massariosphaeria phaeospora TaxID=100035 RepID=A0A7C8MUZ1_9PLEO|nr:hypothetical protein BDV95DRAFT_481536 [Massariosphaeria phaeospora]